MSITLTFVFSDGTTHDASISEASESLELCFNSGWSLTPVSSGLGGSPTYTLEVSNDNTNWFSYEEASEDVSIEDGLDDTHQAFLYARINYDAFNNNTGTVSFQYTIKRRNG